MAYPHGPREGGAEDTDNEEELDGDGEFVADVVFAVVVVEVVVVVVVVIGVDDDVGSERSAVTRSTREAVEGGANCTSTSSCLPASVVLL